MVLAAAVLVFLTPAAFAGLHTKSRPKTKNAESGLYRVFYEPGGVEKRPGLGEGLFREINYKVVFQGDWVPNEDRLIEVLFLDPEEFIAGRDVLADKDLAPHGEYYGSVWVPEAKSKKIRGVKVVEASKAPPPPPLPKPEPTVLPPPDPEQNRPLRKNNGPKGLFGTKVITDEDILKLVSRDKKPDENAPPPDAT